MWACLLAVSSDAGFCRLCRDSMYSLLKHSKYIPRVKSPHSSCLDWEELYRSDRQAGPYSPGLVGKPCCSVQHLQNCRVATKSNLWVSAYIRSAACSKCELASPRKWLWSIYSSNRSAAVRFACCNRVWKLTTLSLLQYLIWCSYQFQSLFWKHKHAFTCLKWIAGHAVPRSKCRSANHQNYNWLCYLSRSTYSCMWAWPAILHRKWFRTIQSYVMSKDDYSL